MERSTIANATDVEAPVSPADVARLRDAFGRVPPAPVDELTRRREVRAAIRRASGGDSVHPPVHDREGRT